jgi:hypothetical protein
MKKLGKLEISPEKIMKNEELINLQGGYEGCPWYSCQCYGTAGTWHGSYCSAQAVADAISYWCINGTGGNCTYIGY